VSYYPVCNNCKKQVYIAPTGDVTACGKTYDEQWDFHNLHFCKPDWKLRSVEYQARIRELEAWKSDVMHVINESSGVAGYHLNGEIATWGELGLEGES
jgi:hypothetical protein